MTKKELITKVKKYFALRELVCRHVFDKYGETAWQFLQYDYLYLLLILREDILKKPMVVNNWGLGGSYSQRGLRCNICQIPSDKTKAGKPYMSAHCMGCAVDCTVSGMTAEEARQLIKANLDKIPFNLRMEEGVSWLHVDTYDNGTETKLITFTE